MAMDKKRRGQRQERNKIDGKREDGIIVARTGNGVLVLKGRQEDQQREEREISKVGGRVRGGKLTEGT
jgi:hypothetical protein